MDEHSPSSSRIHTLNALQEQIMALLPEPGRLQTTLSHVHVSHLSVSSGMEHCFYSPGAAFIISGRKHAHLGRKTVTYGAGYCMVAAVDMPSAYEILDVSPEHPFLSVMVSLDAALIADCLQLFSPQYFKDAKDADSEGAVIIEASDTLLMLVKRLLEQHGKPQAEIMEPLLLREFFIELLQGPAGASLRGIFRRDSRAHKIAETVHYLREHYREPLNIKALADMVYMAPSTFFKHFKAVTTLSPLQYHKRLRLYEAKRLLLTERCTVAEACYSVGYESQQQFTREYKRMFGRPPRRDTHDGSAFSVEDQAKKDENR